MAFKKLNLLQKLYLKFTDKFAYRQYKYSVTAENFAAATRKLVHPNLNHPYKKETHFKHSGNSGDLIYCLPSMFALAKNGKAHIHLNPGEKFDYPFFNPLGNVMLNEKTIEMLKPLLLHQPQIETCDNYNNQHIDYDLDLFRRQPFIMNRGSIVRWYFHVFAVFADTSLPWLIAPKNEAMRDYIVITRSHRYRNPGINYSFLKKYPKVIFLGLPIEYEDMKKEIPDIEYYPVNDFLETASVINGSKLFIGNQTFNYAIAEALKVNRLLEIYFDAPNVIPEGKGAYDFYYQPHFEKTVEKLYNTD